MARSLPLKWFLVALLLLSIFLVFSATAVFGHTKRDASNSRTIEMNDISGSPSAKARDHSTENDASGLRPDVNRDHDLVLVEDFESGVGPGISLSNGATVVCEEGNCFVKQVATALQDVAPNITVGQNSWQDYNLKFRFNVRSGSGEPHVPWHENVDGRYFISAIGQTGFQLIAENIVEQNVRLKHRFDDIRSPYQVHEWNTPEVQADRDRIRVVLNGTVVADEVVPVDFQSSTGRASIRTLSAVGGDVEIWYDDLEVRLLNLPEPPPAPTPTPTPTPTPRPATIPAAEIVLVEDFESGVGPGLTLNNGATIACEEGNCFVKHVATSLQVASPNVWSSLTYLEDYTFNFRFNVRSGKGGPTVYLRWTVDGSYEIRANGQTGFQFRARKTIEQNVNIEHRFNDIRSPYAVREWNAMQVRAEGDRISVFMNGDLVADEVVPADFRFATGSPGINTNSAAGGDVEIWYDDLEVRLLNRPEPTPTLVRTPTPRPIPTSAPSTPAPVTGSRTSTTSPTPAPSSLPGSDSSGPTVTESSGDSKVAEEKADRGFFTNTRPGESTLRANSLFDPTILAVIGIMITMLATMVQLFKGQ